MGRRSFRRMWYAAVTLVPLPFIGVGYAVASGSLFGSEVELFLPAPGTVSTAVRTVSATGPSIVSSAASRLFYTDGKGPRADRFAVSDTPPIRPFITASLTGMVGLPKGANEDAAEAKDEEAEKGAPKMELVDEERRAPESSLFQPVGYASPFNSDFQVDAFRPDPHDIAYRPTEEALNFRYQGETQAEFEDRERRCLATAIYFEARGEPLKGQIAVSQVILDRVRSPKFPQTICGVVYQGQYRKGCQFSFTCDGQSDTPRDKAQWAHAQELDDHVTREHIALYVNRYTWSLGEEGRAAACDILVEAGRVCAFNTFGGIMESTEWNALIRPTLASPSRRCGAICTLMSRQPELSSSSFAFSPHPGKPAMAARAAALARNSRRFMLPWQYSS